MTRNWTDYPIVPRLTPRKRIHIEELWGAYKERMDVLSNDDYILRPPVPGTLLYNSDPNIEWDVYPKADPAHYPPNVSPDNKFRNDIVYAMRDTACHKDLMEWNYLIIGEGSLEYPTCGYFVRMKDDEVIDKYGCYGHRKDSSSSIFSVFVEDNSLPTSWTDNTLTANETNVRAIHIEEIRPFFEAMQWIPRATNKIDTDSRSQIRYKSAYGDWDEDRDTAWASAKSAFSSASWSDWEDDNHIQMSTSLQKSGSDYKFYIYAEELKSEFDLDLNIYGDDHDYNDGAKAMLLSTSVALGIDGGYGDVDNYGDVFLKCKETGDVVSATGSESIVANENDQFIVCDDISEYLGNYATFTFTAKNEYSDDDLIK